MHGLQQSGTRDGLKGALKHTKPICRVVGSHTLIGENDDEFSTFNGFDFSGANF
jgi:hypothetical protein